jgi:hypothetical protein
MSSYTATIRWSRDPSTDFAKGQYSRAHEWVVPTHDNVIVMCALLHYLPNEGELG